MKKSLLAFSIMIVVSTNASAQFRNLETDTLTVLNKYFNVNDSQLTSFHTLNVFFANRISSYLSEAGDLNLSKGYALLDNSDNRLFLGGNFTLGKAKKQEGIGVILTTGIKANVKDGFAGLVGKGVFKDDIGVSAKFTFFANGSIWFDTIKRTQKEPAQNYREILKADLLNTFDDELTKQKAGLNLLKINDQKEKNLLQDSLLLKFIKSKTKEIDEKFPEKEYEAIVENKWNNLAHTWWLSMEVYVPISNSKYAISPVLTNRQIDTVNYKPAEITLTHTHFWEKNKIVKLPIPKGKYYLTGSASLLWYNNVKTESLKDYTYEQLISQGFVDPINYYANSKQDKVYVGKYESFKAFRMRCRFVYMPLSFLGISAGIEKFITDNKYDYSPLNWKLGIPVSLKDKDGKAKVNFELQWREINKEHSVGLSIAFPFGGTTF